MTTLQQPRMRERRVADGRLRAPWERWRQVIGQSVRDLWSGSVLEWASSIAFYAFLSIFPLFIALLIAASYILDVDWATQRATQLLGSYLPEGEIQVGAIIADAIAARGHVGPLSFIVFLITGRRVLGVLTTGLNHVSDVAETEDRLKRRIGVEGALMLGVVVLMLLALSARPLVDLAWKTLRAVPGPDDLLLTALLAAVRVLLILTMFTLVYAFVPRGQRLWRAVLTGAATATALFLLTEGIFGVVADRIWQTLVLLYGPLALAALLLSWSWYVALITLVCGGFASHVKVMILEERSGGEARRRHVQQ